MKTIAIGDIHGIKVWEKIVDREKGSRVVFIGDYFDSFHVPATEQIENFKKIVKFKLANEDRVTMLVGNHELHYLTTVHERYSGYQRERAVEIGRLLMPLIKDRTIVVCHKEGKHLFSHAGFTTVWCEDYKLDPKAEDFVQKVNDMFLEMPEAFCFNKYDRSGFGESPLQGPLWVRPDSLGSCRIKGITQVVGHSHMDHITYENGSIFIDTLEKSGEYLEIVGDKATTHEAIRRRRAASPRGVGSGV